MCFFTLFSIVFLNFGVLAKESVENTSPIFNRLKLFNITISSLTPKFFLINIQSKTYPICRKLILLFVIIILALFSFLLINICKSYDAKTALIESEERLRILINSSPDLICLKDSKGRWLETNKCTLNFFKIKNLCWKGKTVEELCKLPSIYKTGFMQFQNSDIKAWESKDILRYKEKFEKGEDNILVYDIVKIPVFYNNGNKKYMVIIVRDITVHTKAEQNKFLLEKMVEYERLRTEFFSNLSHELRTPLNVILSALQYIELINQDNTIKTDKENLEKYIYIMKQSSYRLVRIVNNLIDITKIDAGYFQLNLDNYNIVDVVENITLSVVSYVENKNLTLTFDTEIEERIMACDPYIIERIILNLLSNAIKFTNSNGKIFVNIYDKKDSVKISVKDTGIGIPKNKQKIIFERFIQVDKSLSRAREGSGIGLSIVSSLVKLLNGSIKVISNPKCGSEFIITLPIYTLKDREIKIYPDPNTYENNKDRIIIEFSDIYS